MRKLIWLLWAGVLSGCAPYAEPVDPYITGMRWFNHKEYKFAQKFWAPLAEEEDCDAQFRMGTLYFMGAGVPQSYEKARDWWLKAGTQGQSFAQALLATMYAHDSLDIFTIRTRTTVDCTGGCGCEKNMVEAYRWMRLSERCAVYDDTRQAAKMSADRYQAALTTNQVFEADYFVQKWKAPAGAVPPRQLD